MPDKVCYFRAYDIHEQIIIASDIFSPFMLLSAWSVGMEQCYGLDQEVLPPHLISSSTGSLILDLDIALKSSHA